MFLSILMSSLKLNNNVPYLFVNLVLVWVFIYKWVCITYLMLYILIKKKYVTCLWLFFPHLHVVYAQWTNVWSLNYWCGYWTTGVVIELLGGNWTNKKKKTTQDSYNYSCHKDLYWKNIWYKPSGLSGSTHKSCKLRIFTIVVKSVPCALQALNFRSRIPVCTLFLLLSVGIFLKK